MDPEPRVLSRAFQALTGLAIAIYLVGFVVVAPTEWHRFSTSPERTRAAVAGIGLGVIWVVLILMLVTTVVRQLRGRAPGRTGGGMVWLSTFIIAVISFTLPSHGTSARPSNRAVVAAVSSRGPTTSSPHVAAPSLERLGSSKVASLSARELGFLPMALIAKRRRDELARSHEEISDDDVDDTIDELRWYDENVLDALRDAIGDRPSGLVALRRDQALTASREATNDSTPVVAVVVALDDAGWLIAFARPGTNLPIGLDAVDLVARYGAVLSGRGRCQVANNPLDALRTLALRTSFDDVVVYLGASDDLDAEVSARCVSIGDGPDRRERHVDLDGHRWSFAQSNPDLAATPRVLVGSERTPASIRVELLRADPSVIGLVEPFTATLRRRCVEMTAYLAVHHHEPVTGDRLRARVLGSGDDASLRTLSNTATAVRRSLGSDEAGARLHPVTPAGLYQLHDVDCDLVEFHQLVSLARTPDAVGVAATLTRALSLVRGEPLATALRGFEWFLAEGHLARLQRDGEWAALRLAAEARDQRDFDLAFWAIEQGRLIDPYSEALEAALHRVPRLREFGGDRAGGAQHETVGAR